MGWLMRFTSRQRIFAEAVQWVDSIKDDRSTGSALLKWARRSPQHVEALVRVSVAWADVAALTPEQRERIERLAHTLRTEGRSAGNIVRLPGLAADQSSARAKARPPWRVVAVLGCILVLAAIPLVTAYLGRDTYQTAEGEVRVVVLADGSRLHLNARTRVVVRFTRHTRLLELLEGEALFDVAPDTTRPFRISARGASVQALGTQFDVQLTDRDLVVTVNRGRVAMAADEEALRGVILEPEQRGVVHFDRDRPVTEVVKLDAVRMRETFAWTGTLALDGISLKEAVARFNRANTTQLVIADPSISGIRVGGAMSLIDPDGFVRALRALHVSAKQMTIGRSTAYYLTQSTEDRADAERHGVAQSRCVPACIE